MNGRHWTAAELERVRAMHPDHTAAQIGLVLGRSPSAIGQAVRKLGLRKLPDRTPLLPRVRELHGRGLTDTAIAEALAAELCGSRHPRREAGRLRAALGLAPNAEAILAARRRGVRAQAAKLGIGTPAELRSRKHRAFAAGYGLPAELGPRHVQAVLALASGPKTKRQLCEALGMTFHPQSRRTLKSNGPGGSYPADLIRLGLVAARRAYRAGWRTGFDAVYALTPKALDLLAQKGGA